MNRPVTPVERFPKMRHVYHGEDIIGIQCLGCGRCSYNENDRKEVYCGNCHKFGSLL